MIWGVYAATYITANMVGTTCQLSQVDDTLPKFVGTTVVNIATCVAKVTDRPTDRPTVHASSCEANEGSVIEFLRTIIDNLSYNYLMKVSIDTLRAS